MAGELPLFEADPQLGERADAARNRRRILVAAQQLVAERGIEGISMQDVAAAASVGTGTLYRRFGDRAGLALALLEERTRAFQDALIAGPPALGPGAPAVERLRAFGDGFLDLLEQDGELLAAAGRPPPGRSGPQDVYLTHLTILLREAAPELDAEFTAQALFGALAPGLHRHLRREVGWSAERLRRGWRQLVDGVCGAG